MRTSPPPALPLFRSHAQLRMLARILLDGDGVTAQQLQRASGMSAASLHRELERADVAGLVTRDDSRRPFVYRPDEQSPLLEPIVALLRMTVGAEHEIAEALHGLDGIKVAAIFGSHAADTGGPRSDVDVLVVGDVEERRLRSVLRGVGKRLGRHIDLTLLRPTQIAELAREGNPFLETVLDRPRIDLIGSIDAYTQAA